MYAGHIAIAAATDARILAARATFPGRVVSATELARAAGVSPPTARTSARRLAAARSWPYPPLVRARTFPGKACPVGPQKGRRFIPPLPAASYGPAPAYLLHRDAFNLRPRDLGDTKAASAEALALWRAAVAAGRRRGVGA